MSFSLPAPLFYLFYYCFSCAVLYTAANPHSVLKVSWPYFSASPSTHPWFLLEVAGELLFPPGLVHIRWPLLASLLRHFGPPVGIVVSHGGTGQHCGPRPMLLCPALPSGWGSSAPALSHIVTSWVDLTSSRLSAPLEPKGECWLHSLCDFWPWFLSRKRASGHKWGDARKVLSDEYRGILWPGFEFWPRH